MSAGRVIIGTLVLARSATPYEAGVVVDILQVDRDGGENLDSLTFEQVVDRVDKALAAYRHGIEVHGQGWMAYQYAREELGS